MKRLIYILIGSVLTLILYGCASYNRNAAIRRLRTAYVYETDDFRPHDRRSIIIYRYPHLMTINKPVYCVNYCGTYAWSNDTLMFYPSLCLWVALDGSLGFDSVKEDEWIIPDQTLMFRCNHTGDTLTDITSYPDRRWKNMKYIFKR